MAKPGSNGARRIGARAHDLSRKALTDDEAQAAQEMIELQLGMRCNGCRRRITFGLDFTSIDPRHEDPVRRVSACNRGDCDFAEKARVNATSIQMVEYAWADANGADAPVSSMIKHTGEAKVAKRSRADEIAPG